MSTKRKCESLSVTKKRKWLTLEQKLDIIKLLEEGASFAKIGRDKGMDESSVRKLIKKKDQYKSHGNATSYLSKIITKNRSTRMVNMERLLSIWIEDLNKKRIPLSQMKIQAKALKLYTDLKENEKTENEGGETNTNFTASRGWFFRFKKRTGINNVGECASAYKEAALKYHQELKEIIENGKDKKKLDMSSFNEANSALSRGGMGVAGCIEEQGEGLHSENLEHGTTLSALRPESYNLCRNNHLSLIMESLARDESFMDVTLTAQGKAVKAHKSVLSAVSPYFQKVLKENPCQHPIIIMPRDIQFEELNNIIKYVYKGEMTVAAEELSSLLKTGEVLQVAGLSSIGSAGLNPDSFIGQNQGITKGLYHTSALTVNSTNKPSFTSEISSEEPLSHLNENLPLSATGIEGSEKIDFLKSNMVLIKEEIDIKDEEIEEYHLLPVDETEEYHPSPADHKSCVSSVHASTSVECSASMRSSSQNGVNLKINDLGNFSPKENNLLAENANKIFNPGEIFSTPSSQEESNASSAATPYVCPHCLETHRLNETLQVHLRIKHPSKPSFICVCGRVFLKQNLLTNHKKKCDL